MTRHVLVLNSGSSSMKYQLVDPDGEQALASGLVERIGEADRRGHAQVRRGDAEQCDGADRRPRRGSRRDHAAAVRRARVSRWTGRRLIAVGHRVVHGGSRVLRPGAGRRRGAGSRSTSCRCWPRCTTRPTPPGIEQARAAFPGRAAGGRLRHRVLPRPAGRRRHLRDRPRRGRRAPGPALRLPRHLAPVRLRAGRSGCSAATGDAEPDRAAPGQRRVGLGDPRRPCRWRPRWASPRSRAW